jgi:ribosome-binding protein aMBF1 (putative translation factor)
MKAELQKRLERAGWRVGDADDFLELTEHERRFVEMKLALAVGLREYRQRQGLTQTALARRLRSSQSRVAKMEVADRTVSLDLLVRALLALGATRRDVARLIRISERVRAA